MNSLLRNILLIGALAAFSGCTTVTSNQQYTCTHEQEMEEVHRQLAALAEDFGVDHEQTSRETTLDLISEIRMASRNYKTYFGELLSAEEKETVTIYLNNKTNILNKILEQDLFVRSLNKKRIIILPDKD